MFRMLPQSEAPESGGVLASRGSPAREAVGSGSGTGWKGVAGGQAEVGEDLGNPGGRSMAAMIFKAPPHWERVPYRSQIPV